MPGKILAHTSQKCYSPDRVKQIMNGLDLIMLKC